MDNNYIRVANNLSHKELFDKKIWYAEDVMNFLNVTYSALTKMTSVKKIPFRKRCGKLIFMPLEILEWIDEGVSK